MAAAAAAKISARRRHGKKNQDFSEILENGQIVKKHRKNRYKSIKTLIFEEQGKNGRHHQILHKKLAYIDLFSCLYDQTWHTILSVHVGKRSRMSVHNCMYARNRMAEA